MFPHLVAAFIVACVSVTLSFAMFATPGLDNVLLRVCSVDLEDCFWSQVWAHVSRGRLHGDFVLSTLPFMFPHLVAAFIVACVSVTLSFAMFATPGLDNVLLRVCSVYLEDCFWSQVWAHVSRGWLSFSLTHSLGALVPSIPSFVVLHRHRRLVCACLVC
ncbi:hypothetical protein HID58_063957, partial [Brassica napus]